MTETVTRLRATTSIDGHGNAVRSWVTPDRLDIDGADVAWGTAIENFGRGRTDTARDATVVNGTVFLPGSPDIVPSDRLQVRGLDYDVVGHPGDWNDPGGDSFDVGGLVVTIQLVAG